MKLVIHIYNEAEVGGLSGIQGQSGLHDELMAQAGIHCATLPHYKGTEESRSGQDPDVRSVLIST